MRIGVSGARGSFSEEAARLYAKEHAIENTEYAYLITVENVLASLERGDIDVGIFPIENSSGGPVTETLEAMPKHTFTKKDSFEIDIRQNLIAQKGVKGEEIRAITSHDQALKQCKSYLAKNWGGTELREYEDTAKAAEDLAAGKLPRTTAVIASRTAAEVYGLEIIEESIQDLKTNFTTFIAATR